MHQEETAQMWISTPGKMYRILAQALGTSHASRRNCPNVDFDTWENVSNTCSSSWDKSCIKKKLPKCGFRHLGKCIEYLLKLLGQVLHQEETAQMWISTPGKMYRILAQALGTSP